MRSTLVDPRAFKCPHCSKSFHCSSHLTTHVRTHTGERPYKCGQCPKSFALLGNLTAHVRTHTGEKPYSCKFCTKSFTQSTNLNVHMRVHTGERPYKCERCQKAFKTSGALNGHVKSCYKIVRRFAAPVLRQNTTTGSALGASYAGRLTTTSSTIRNTEKLLPAMNIQRSLPSDSSLKPSVAVSSETSSSSLSYSNSSLFNYRRRKISDIIAKKRFGGAQTVSMCKPLNVSSVTRTCGSTSNTQGTAEKKPSCVNLNTFKQETTPSLTPVNGIFESRQHNKSGFPRESLKDGSNMAAAAAVSANKLLGREMISEDQNFNIYDNVHKSTSNETQQTSTITIAKSFEDSKDFLVSSTGFSQQPTIHSNGDSLTVDFNSLVSLSEISQDKVEDVFYHQSQRQTGGAAVQFSQSGIVDSQPLESKSAEIHLPENSGASCPQQDRRSSDGTNYGTVSRNTPSKSNVLTGHEMNNPLTTPLHQKLPRSAHSLDKHNYCRIQSPLLTDAMALSSDRTVPSLTHSSPDPANSCLAFLEVSTYTQIFKCKLCNLVFETKDDFLHHTPLHEDDELLVCKFCEMDFKTPLDLVLHQKDHNLPEQLCELCNQMVLSTRFAAHLNLHATAMKRTTQETRIFWCHFCDKSFIDQSYLDLHLRVHSIQKPLHFSSSEQLQSKIDCQQRKPFHEKSFKCPYCQKKFHYSKSLIAHMHSHSVQRLYKCKKCRRVLRTVQRFNIHQKICPKKYRHHSKKTALFNHSKTTSKQNNCSSDGTNSYLPEHSIRNSTAVPSKQNITDSSMEVSQSPDSVIGDKQESVDCFQENTQALCANDGTDNGLQNTEDGQSPLQEFVEGQVVKERDVDQSVNSDKVLLRCLCCQMNFSSKLLLLQHISSQHSSEDQCQFCGTALDVDNDLVSHINCYTTSTIVYRNCRYCPRGFADADSYQSHLAGAHNMQTETQEHDDEVVDVEPSSEEVTSVDLESVPSSGIGFVNCNDQAKQSRKQHHVFPHAQVHFQPRNKCHNCGRTFSSSSQLYVHLVKAHDRLQPHRCHYCKRLFKNCTNFYMHVCTHAPKGSLYECKLCCKSFTQPEKLRTHLQTHSSERPLRCKFCGRFFSKPDNLNAHLRVHTNERPFLCHHCNSTFKTSVARNMHMQNCTVKRLKKKAVSHSMDYSAQEKKALTSQFTGSQSELNSNIEEPFIAGGKDNSPETLPIIENKKESLRSIPANKSTEEQLERSPTMQHVLISDHQQELHTTDMKPTPTELGNDSSLPTIQGFYQNKFCTDNLSMSNSSKSLNYSTSSPNMNGSESKDMIPTSEIGSSNYSVIASDKSVSHLEAEPESSDEPKNISLGFDSTTKLDDRSYLTSNENKQSLLESDGNFFNKRVEAETKDSRQDPCHYKIFNDLSKSEEVGSSLGLYTSQNPSAAPGGSGAGISVASVSVEDEEKPAFTVISSPVDNVIESADDKLGLELNLKSPEDAVPPLFKCLKCFRMFNSAPEYTDHLLTHVWVSTTSSTSSPVGSQTYSTPVDQFEPSNTASTVDTSPPLTTHQTLLPPPAPPHLSSTLDQQQTTTSSIISSSSSSNSSLRPNLSGSQSVLYTLQQQQRQQPPPALEQNPQTPDDSKTQLIKCKQCPKKFTKIYSLAVHMKSHYQQQQQQQQNQHICKICPGTEVFPTAKDLSEHLKHHCEFRCKFCQKVVHSASQLYTHMRTHTGEKPFHCPHCPKTFAVNCNLIAHVRIHTGERPFRCQYCDKSFAQATNLNVHTRIHTGERPYLCSKCKRAFRTSSALKGHLKCCPVPL